MTYKRTKQVAIDLFRSIVLEDEGVSLLNAALELFKHGITLNVSDLSKDGFISKETINYLIDNYGIDPIAANATLFTTKETKKMSEHERSVKQSLHYLTSYASREGYDIEPYIPNKETGGEFNISFLKSFKVFHLISLSDIKEKIIFVVTTDVALTSKNIADIAVSLVELDVPIEIPSNGKELSDILVLDKPLRNKELALYIQCFKKQFLNNADLFVAAVYYALTSNTVMIKSKENLRKISKGSFAHDKDRNVEILVNIQEMIKAFTEQHSDQALAENYRSHKKLWLVIKHFAQTLSTSDKDKVSQLLSQINKIGRLSKRWHIPKKQEFTWKLDKEWVASKSTYEILKLYSAIKERLYFSGYYGKDVQLGVHRFFRIRNGYKYHKEASTQFIFDCFSHRKDLLASLFVIEGVLEERYAHLKGKTYYIPEGIDYKLPTTQKGDFGDVPQFTTIKLPKNAQVGIYWEKDVDYDLHALSEFNHTGWNWGADSYISGTTFSGDMITTNSKGFAAEWIGISTEDITTNILMQVNAFSVDDEQNVTIMVAENNLDDEFDKEHLLPENLLLSTKIKFYTGGYCFALIHDRELTFVNLRERGRVPLDVLDELSEAIALKQFSMLSLEEFFSIVEAERVEVPEEAELNFDNGSVHFSSFVELLSLENQK